MAGRGVGGKRVRWGAGRVGGGGVDVGKRRGGRIKGCGR